MTTLRTNMMHAAAAHFDDDNHPFLLRRDLILILLVRSSCHNLRNLIGAASRRTTVFCLKFRRRRYAGVVGQSKPLGSVFGQGVWNRPLIGDRSVTFRARGCIDFRKLAKWLRCSFLELSGPISRKLRRSPESRSVQALMRRREFVVTRRDAGANTRSNERMPLFPLVRAFIEWELRCFRSWRGCRLVGS